MSVAGRGRVRPVLYPLGIVVAFVEYELVRTGVSPYSAGRPLPIAVGLGIAAAVLLVAVFALVLAGGPGGHGQACRIRCSLITRFMSAAAAAAFVAIGRR